MHIILDSNIYAADYRMNGVAFQSLFEYMRRTESRLVLPRVIREEVVIDYGRRLKTGAKAFEDACRKYHHLDLESDVLNFRKPDGKYAMKRLRRKLMKPADGVVPIYFHEITGDFLQEAFMRGIHRARPANNNGEELRDVILWLWTLAYSDKAGTEVVFVSGDGGFWADDAIHPDIDRDLSSKNGKLHIYRSIQDFLKAHAPTPVEVTEEWSQKHFEVQSIERELIDRAARELSRATRDIISALSIKECKVIAGKLYEVSDDAQFAELELQLTFKFLMVPSPPQQQLNIFPLGFQPGAFGPGWGGKTLSQNALAARLQNVSYLSNVNRLLAEPEPQRIEQALEALECKAEARVSLRIKHNKTTEISVDTLKMDRANLLSVLYS
jgi:hypothetical protein